MKVFMRWRKLGSLLGNLSLISSRVVSSGARACTASSTVLIAVLLPPREGCAGPRCLSFLSSSPDMQLRSCVCMCCSRGNVAGVSIKERKQGRGRWKNRGAGRDGNVSISSSTCSKVVMCSCNGAGNHDEGCMDLHVSVQFFFHFLLCVRRLKTNIAEQSRMRRSGNATAGSVAGDALRTLGEGTQSPGQKISRKKKKTHETPSQHITSTRLTMR